MKDKEFKIVCDIDGIKIQVIETQGEILNSRLASSDGVIFLSQKVHTSNVFLHVQKIAMLYYRSGLNRSLQRCPSWL